MPVRPSVLASLFLALSACKPQAPAPDGNASPQPDATAPASAVDKAAGAINPLSSPMEELEASTALFRNARSYHAVMSAEGAQAMDNEIDFVAPDRYRMQMPMGTQVIIGDTMYMQIEGRSVKVPMPKGTLTSMRDPMRMQEAREGMGVEALGSDPVDGQVAKKYLVRYTRPQAGEFTLWIGSDGLPLQFIQHGQAQGKAYTMTTRYSRFNDPSISIDAPE